MLIEKKKPLTDKEIREQIVQIIKKHLPDCAVVLFGSRATGTNKENSDYDIAIKYGKKIPAKKIFSIIEETEKLRTLKIIEIIDYSLMDDDFQYFVDKEGIVLYDGKTECAN